MSDIYVHLKAANEIYHHLSFGAQEIIQNNENAFNLGAQGPDILFYHRIFPWTSSSELKKIANIIHRENTTKFFITGFNLIKKENNPARKSLLTSYFYGFLTHYAIDTHTHPYIFYHSGHEGGYNHKYFECILDTIIAKTTSNEFAPTHKKVTLKANERLIIATFLQEVVVKVFNIRSDIKAIQESLVDMTKVLALLNDPFHLKKPVLILIDKLSGSKGKIKTAIFPSLIDSSVDYLNLKHKTWYHPCSPHEMFKTSFLDLVQSGEAFAIELIQDAEAFVSCEKTNDSFKATLKNLTYNTGLDCRLKAKMTRSKKIVQYK